MITDESIMQEMLERATNPTRDVDELAVQMFCMVVRQSPKQQMENAQKCLLTKIQSRDEIEATRAIALLEEAMAHCGPDFQDEIGKFRFLNELIRLVSKNHQGADTPVPIKKRILECLLLWTTLYPQKTKIREVYDMLKKEGMVDHGPTSLAAPKNRDNILGKDTDVFNKLIQSGDPENFKRANLLVQSRVNEEVRRNEFRLQQKNSLQEVQNTVGLLNQMLDTFAEEGGDDTDGSDTMNLIRELYLSCKKHKTHLERMRNIEHMESDLLADTLETNDIENGEKIVSNVNASKSNTDLLTELLNNTDVELSPSISTNVNASAGIDWNTQNNLHDIDDLLGAESVLAKKPEKNSILEDENPIFPMSDILNPVTVSSRCAKEEKVAAATPSPEKRRNYMELREIDQLSEQLLKESLSSHDRIVKSKWNDEKQTLNDLCKQKTMAKPTELPTSQIRELSAAVSRSEDNTAEPDTLSLDEPILLNAEVDDDSMLTKSETLFSREPEQSADKQVNTSKPLKQAEQIPHKHLSDIEIDLDDIVPTGEEHLLLNDDDIKVTLNFTENRPSPNVSVIVISVLNKSKLPVKDFQFEASAKKPNKVRLLPPSDTGMPAYKSFRPPTPINQVMLLLNSTGKSVDVTCIVGYKLGADPDPIKESIIARDIPYVD